MTCMTILVTQQITFCNQEPYCNTACVLKSVHVFPVAAPSSPVSFELADIDGEPNQLMASWSPPNLSNGIITAYTVFCRIVPDEEFSIEAYVNGSVVAVKIMGLMPFTSYECYVTANTSIGEGPPSNNGTAMTDEDSKFYA